MGIYIWGITFGRFSWGEATLYVVNSWGQIILVLTQYGHTCPVVLANQSLQRQFYATAFSVNLINELKLKSTMLWSEERDVSWELDNSKEVSSSDSASDS